jgi:hypothetical protein
MTAIRRVHFTNYPPPPVGQTDPLTGAVVAEILTQAWPNLERTPPPTLDPRASAEPPWRWVGLEDEEVS